MQNTRASRWRIWHRWLSLIFGLQMVIWAISGAYMVFFDLDFIHGDHLVRDIRESLPREGKVASLDKVLARYPDAQSMALETRWLNDRLRKVYSIDTTSGQLLIDAESLTVIDISERDIRALANRYYAQSQSPIESVTYLTDNPPAEISPRLLPVWQVNYDDFGNTSLYLSDTTGELLVKRHTFWRGFDVFWMLHIMDYDERVDIETWWLKAFIIGTFILLITGTVLLVYTVRFKTKPAGGPQ